MSTRLVLGTAQFGSNYGVANFDGIPDDNEIEAILCSAHDRGVAWLDTAQDYGNSEQRIGVALAKLKTKRKFKIATKISQSIDYANRSALVTSVKESANKLGQTPTAILVHNPDLISNWVEGIGDALLEIRDLELTDSLGASVYTPEQFLLATNTPEIDFIQAPINILDKRLEKFGLLDRAAAKGKTIFVRSIFLQGLLTLDAENLPNHMKYATGDIDKFRDVCKAAQIEPAHAAFRFVLQRYPEVLPVLGCQTDALLKKNLSIVESDNLDEDIIEALAAIPQGKESVINPVLWPVP
jgi:aryl-alcohol dehydrogenase-like predicted oxidoreductase